MDFQICTKCRTELDLDQFADNPRLPAGRNYWCKVCVTVHKYGMNRNSWDALLLSQGLTCALCKRADPGPRGWHTDHCHESGKVRGILCASCNLGLGFFRDDASALEAASRYVKHHRTKAARARSIA